MKLHRSGAFLGAYRFLPHRLLNRAFAVLAQARRPRFLVGGAIRAWVRRGHIDLDDFVPETWESVEAFFLRRLQPGARPLKWRE